MKKFVIVLLFTQLFTIYPQEKDIQNHHTEPFPRNLSETRIHQQYDSSNLELISQWGYGNVTTIDYNDSLAVINSGLCELHIIDISDKMNPQFVGKVLLPYQIYDVHISGNHVYVATGIEGMRIIDIHNPESPEEVGYIGTQSRIMNLEIDGNYAFVADEDDGLRVINISDPENPYEVGNYPSVYDVVAMTIREEYIYMVEFGQGLHVIDISEPVDPSEVGNFLDNGLFMNVSLYGDYAYIDKLHEFDILDITDLTNISKVGSFQYEGRSGPMCFMDSLGIILDYEWGLRVVDLSDPLEPELLALYELRRGIANILLDEKNVYAASRLDGMIIFDYSDPFTPTKISTYDTPDYFIHNTFISDTLAFVAADTSGLRIVNISDIENPFEIGYYDTPGESQDVTVEGKYAFIADGSGGGLRILNISDPINPVETGFYDTPDNAQGVTVVGNYAYVGDDEAGIRIIDISDKSNPHEVGFVDTPGETKEITIQDTLAFLGDGENGMVILDISDPTDPIVIATYDTPDYAREIVIKDNLAYIADSDGGGIIIVDISNPSNPRRIGSTILEQQPFSLRLNNNFLYSANNNGGLRITDVSDPTTPCEVDAVEFYRVEAKGVELNNGYIFLSTNMGGLLTYKHNIPLPKELSLSYPSGGEKFCIDSLITIKWKSDNVDTINIIFSSDNGSTWTTIANDISATNGAYEWTIPPILSEECKLKIYDPSDREVFSQTNSNFAIRNQVYLILLSPSGGESLNAWDTFKINWESLRIQSVDIAYSINNGDNWINIAEQIDASLNEYIWKIPNTPSQYCMVRISDSNDSSFFSQNITSFSIEEKQIELSINNLKYQQRVDSSFIVDISYRLFCNIDHPISIFMEASNDSGKTYDISCTELTGDIGDSISTGYLKKIHWHFNNEHPSTFFENCRLKIFAILWDDSTTSGSLLAKDSMISEIKPISSLLLLRNPNSGGYFYFGDEVTVSWVYDNSISNVDVHFSLNNQMDWIPIVLDHPTEENSILWATPKIIANQCFLRVSSSDNRQIYDISDLPIAIDTTLTDINEIQNQVPLSFALYSAFPNPFNPRTNIGYTIPESGYVCITVYNLMGEEVAILSHGFKQAGYHNVQWDATEQPSGIYLYEMRCKNFRDVKKMLFIK